jgi:hypothetical protein
MAQGDRVCGDIRGLKLAAARLGSQPSAFTTVCACILMQEKPEKSRKDDNLERFSLQPRYDQCKNKKRIL